LKVTVNWLNEFLDPKITDPVIVSDSLTMSGTEVKKIDYIGDRYKNIAVGEILDFSAHPDAKKLSLCEVDIGSEKLKIVCGAKNFKKGDKVAVALPGSKVKGLIIKKSKIRGQISEGMMCSEMELGISSDSEGIMILDRSSKTGDGFSKSVGLDDIVLELEITPNRPDCMSIIGIAREISALTDSRLIIPDYDLKKKLNIDNDLKIKIEDHKLCPRYSAKIFENIPDIASPYWLKNRLMLCDIRPISLMVDLTNYIMLETGQPLHAFDKDLMDSNIIIVRNARKDEEIKTIDDSTRILEDDALVIADQKRAVAIAGIMGGKETEINQDTRTVLLESANFYGPSIMRTSKKLGLRSEASNRFEKKIDPLLTVFAVERFNGLFEKITDLKVEGCIYDNYIEVERERKIDLRVKKVGEVLGKDIDAGMISDILKKLKINNRLKGEIIKAVVPSFRYEDLEREIDLVEEVARIYGYDKLDSIPTPTSDRRGKYSDHQRIIKDLRQGLCDAGLIEVINYSFIGVEHLEKYKILKEDEYNKNVVIINPISEDFKLLRPMLMTGLIRNVEYNINHNIKDIEIFEISRVFRNTSKEELPEEINMLGVMMSGKAVKKGWAEEERDYDFFDLRGILELICNTYYPEESLKIREKEYDFLHPRISGVINIGNIDMGIIGKIHPLLIEEAEIGQDVFYMEINIDKFVKNAKRAVRFKSISPFPSIDIDLAIVVDQEVKNEDIINEIKKTGTELLKKVELFDVYKGKQIEKDKKSMAYSLRFRDDKRTLKDTEAEIILNRILENLGRKFNAKIRE
jgi:phenylalanyl-tRNA synthetase beta chain